ncbi:MAG: tetratricopeptide repeat protein [Alphaproteobacteria bacterium]|nr:tetratricopeptide repeat protein [Alphaproteobacteria bacterium]
MTQKLSINGKIAVFAISLAALALNVAATAPNALAAGSDSNWGSDSEKKQNPDWAAAKKKIADKDYAGAIPHLQKYIGDNPKNANAHNYLGYALRNLGKLKESGVAYSQALTHNPKHLGALEYQGRLYLKLGQVAKAKANLAKLDGLCFFGCDEYTELKNAIAQHKGS